MGIIIFFILCLFGGILVAILVLGDASRGATKRGNSSSTASAEVRAVIRGETRINAVRILRDCIIERIGFLRRERAKCIGRWGDRDELAWQKAKTEFIAEVVTPRVGANGASVTLSEALEMIDSLLDGAQNVTTASDGISYEHACAARLRAAGWSVEITPASGDQGADLLASSEEMRIVVQCKWYNRPVGNSAVQEVAAARAFYRTQAAVVMTNADYTSGARAAAEATDVLLIHHDQADELRNKLMIFRNKIT